MCSEHLLGARSYSRCKGDSREQNKVPALMAFTFHLSRCPTTWTHRNSLLTLHIQLDTIGHLSILLLYCDLNWPPSFQAILTSRVQATLPTWSTSLQPCPFLSTPHGNQCHFFFLETQSGYTTPLLKASLAPFHHLKDEVHLADWCESVPGGLPEEREPVGD